MAVRTETNEVRQSSRARRSWGVRDVSARTASLTPAVGWYVLFFFVPLLWMIRVSFASLQNFHLHYVWSTDAYRQLFDDPLVGELLKRSVLLALVVTALTFVIGFP